MWLPAKTQNVHNRMHTIKLIISGLNFFHLRLLRLASKTTDPQINCKWGFTALGMKMNM
jgi:hypothetical protein